MHKCKVCGAELVAREDGKLCCSGCGKVYVIKKVPAHPIKQEIETHPTQTCNAQQTQIGQVPNSASAVAQTGVENAGNASQVVNTADTEVAQDGSEAAALTAELAKLNARIKELEGSTKKEKTSSKSAKKTFVAIGGFLKKYWMIVLPVCLVMIAFITLMSCFVGVRGVYVNVNDPNDFYSFSATNYTSYCLDDSGEDSVEKGTWKVKNGSIYFTINDEDLGKYSDDLYFVKKSNDTIMIGLDKDNIEEYKRVSLIYYKDIVKKIKVTFNANGGEGGRATEKIKMGERVSEPETPSREDRTFRGWFTDPWGYTMRNSISFNENNRLWEDVTWYANWYNPTPYTATLWETTSLIAYEGDLLLEKLKETETEGYTYDYKINGVLITEATRMPADDVSIERNNPRPAVYTVTFDASGGTFGIEKQTYVYNSIYYLPTEVPQKGDLFFDGWECDGNIYQAGDYFEGIGDKTLTAIWLVEENPNYTRGLVYKGSAVVSIGVATDSNIIIPMFQNGKKITQINKNAFENCTRITSVILPPTLEKIDEEAFKGCISMTSVIIPDSVTSIGNDAFRDCYSLIEVFNKSLNNITVGNTNNGYVGYYAKNVYTPTNGSSKLSTDRDGYIIYTEGSNKILIGCTGTQTALTLPQGITEINNYAFYNRNDLTSVIIPDSVTSIGSRAFYDCYNLIEVYNKSSLTITAGNTNNGYVGCYAKNVYTRTNGSAGTFSTDNRGYVSYVYETGKILLDYVGNDTALTLPQDITEINSHAFFNCNDLTSVIIPDSVTNIGGRAFEGCSNLMHVTIGSGMKSISYNAFYGCLNLIEVYNKSSLEITTDSHEHGQIGNYAKNVYTPTNGSAGTFSTDNRGYVSYVYETGKILLDYVGNDTALTLPQDITEIKEYVFYNRNDLTSVIIPDSVTNIGGRAFEGCSNLMHVTIGSGMKSISYNAFYGCLNLIEVYNKSSLEITTDSYEHGQIGNYAKNVYTPTNGSSKLSTDSNGYTIYTEGSEKILIGYTGTQTALTLPQDITEIKEYVFCNRNDLTSVIIPDSVTNIGGRAFEGCSNLMHVTIGSGMGSIGEYAFYDCYNLIEVYNKSSLEITTDSYEHGQIGNYAKNVYTPTSGSSKLSTDSNGYIIYIEGSEKILVGYTGTQTALTIPQGITWINPYVFRNRYDLTSVIIPDSVTGIDDGAFQGCFCLTSITIPERMMYIYSFAFYGCLNLIEIYNKSSLEITTDSYKHGQIGYYAKNVYTPTSGSSKLSTDSNGYIIYTEGSEKILVGYTGTQTALTIPQDITMINPYVFYNRNDLASVTFTGSFKWGTIDRDGNDIWFSASVDVTDPIANAANLRGARADQYWLRSDADKISVR